ncbi:MULTISPECIES: DUF3192 domain-containing protein [Pseudoalteromonas]|uniref:DUF3192 domain-containing protein n=1 Tax=Pseudoalteromonas haloplanktis TaxID=228 RepID=A0ABU1BD15_PSEHA|nr:MULTISPECIES: DUF3192 domain-containing protein [Pseudoalteromonas]MCF6144924.1 hypothetical protein [Pseudoalteromonas mariniglutinosa NCIMB 1770]MDQ9092275.1 DUF3192 domain-containing protein [Pseudoalteromonas haloplanktis]TMN72059.1 DUF3192 domain-containing protein [Pseudoalteromonas sp. S1727]BDF95362.1 hypothetical protein KAN5_22000 [Pseudoalteromonas sp. KAN5]
MKKVLLIAALTAPFLTGCVIAVSDGEAESHWAGNNSSWEKHHQANREKIASLALDTSYQSVLSQLKTPEFTELLKKEDDVYQVLFYATHSIHSDGKMTKDECTPLVFKNDKLIGVGDSIYNSLNAI